jgi:hypothetical protein
MLRWAPSASACWAERPRPDHRVDAIHLRPSDGRQNPQRQPSPNWHGRRWHCCARRYPKPHHCFRGRPEARLARRKNGDLCRSRRRCGHSRRGRDRKDGNCGTSKPRIKFGAGGDVTEVTLAAGPGALGLTQISEIVHKPGAEFVAPLPDEIQNYTGISAGIPTGPAWKKTVTAFVAFLRSAKAGEAMKAAGMQVD